MQNRNNIIRTIQFLILYWLIPVSMNNLHNEHIGKAS